MADCLFCKVITNNIPSYTVYEDATTRAFLDVFPATDGHVLVVHKRHEEKLTAYTVEELGQLFTTVQKVARALEKTYSTAALSIGLNHGEVKGVHHTHIHLMPRFEGDGGGIMQTLPGIKPKEDLAVVLKKIKASLV
jgi:histidine triad (HIT) family protein